MGGQIQTQDNSFLEILSVPIVLAQQQRISASTGEQTIFHNNNIATQYFIKLLSSFQDEENLEKYKDFLHLIKQSRIPHVVPLFYFEDNNCSVNSVGHGVAKMVCNDRFVLESYYLFCNFSLREVIARGFVSYKNPRFKEEEIWYIASALIEIINRLHKIGLSLGGITTKDIMLTTDGQIMLYPHKLRPDNSHAVFFKIIKNINDISLAYISPDQLKLLKKGSFILKDMLNTLISGDIFCLGMILLQCASFQSSSKYYNISEMSVRTENIKMKIKQLRSNNIVSNQLLTFITKCLEQDTKHRFGLNEAQKLISSHSRTHKLTFLENKEQKNIFVTTRRSSDLSTFSNVSQPFKTRHR